MKKLAIVAYQEYTGHQYAETLEKLFGTSVEVAFYSIYSDLLKNLEADIVVASTYTVCELLKQYVPDFDNITIANITLQKKSVARLRAIPEGTQALLVNVSLQDAIDTISLIHRCGIKHIDFVPAYPPISPDLSCGLAVTPGEIDLVPPGVKKVIDLGERVLSMKTIIEIAIRLNTIDVLHRPIFRQYFDSIISTDTGVLGMLDQINFLEQQLKFVTQVFDSGIMSLSEQGDIIYINDSAARLIGQPPQHMIRKRLHQVLPSLWDSKTPMAIKDKVVTLNSNVLIVSVYPVEYTSVQQGYIVLLKKFTDLEQEQYKIRRQIMARGHAAKYTFDDIAGDSLVIRQTKQLAAKMARSNSSVLIYGQTGTGKELFAQSIHNASPRRNFPFIAINCSAIPESLLESELFGYAEGAFTGARKGGKSGYFEQAHGGTLFLDEISEMNIHLQTRLLRVLQEKEITRIGGDSVINVDVRIIAASNIKLKTLVNQSAFRKDLYYRLNVLSIQIPTLDERRDDIPILVEKMKEGLHARFSLTQDAVELLQNVHFEGNIRELQNLVERLNYSDCQVIDADELKRYLDQDVLGTDSASLQDIEIIERFIKENSHQADRILPVLSILQATCRTSRKLGRKTVLQELEKNGVYFSEQEIRTIFQTLAFHRLIRITRGRGGTCITDLGMKAYYYIMEKGAAQTESPQ